MSALASAPPAAAKAAAWRMAVRLPTLSAAVAPVAVGTGLVLGDGSFAPLPALAALVGALCLQVGANFANDVFDFRRGADTGDRLGPPRATQLGLLTPREMLTGMWLAFALAFLAGLYLAYVGGWPIVVIGLASIVAAIVYTGGPWPVGYHALGDPFTFVFFGVVAVAGTYYVQADDVSALAWLASLPMGCTVTLILVVNNLRDIDTDRASGKTTLAVLIGARATRLWYALLLAGAFVLAFVSVFAGASPLVLLTALSAAAAWRPARAVFSGVSGRSLNPVLKATARFDLVFGLLFAIGLASGRWL